MVATGARDARPQRPGYMVRGDHDEESVALRTGDRYFGWMYEPQPAIIESHVVVGVDPDLNGGAVALRVHPYDTGEATALGVTYSTEKEEDNLGVNVVNATAICEFVKGLPSNGGTTLPEASVDVIIERGSAQGAFRCGYNVGCWAASARNGLHLTAFGRLFGRVAHVDGTTWTSGLWRRGAVPTKRDRVELVETIVPGIDQRLRGLPQAQREGMADAALIAVHELARARALLAKATFPEKPAGVPPLPMLTRWEETTGLEGMHLYKVLRKDELWEMLQGHVRVRRAARKDELLKHVWCVVAQYSDENTD